MTQWISAFHNDQRGISVLTSALIVVLLITTLGLSIISSGLLEGFISEAQRQSQAAEKFKEFKAQERMLRAQLQAIHIRDIDASAGFIKSARRALK